MRVEVLVYYMNGKPVPAVSLVAETDSDAAVLRMLTDTQELCVVGYGDSTGRCRAHATLVSLQKSVQEED